MAVAVPLGVVVAAVEGVVPSAGTSEVAAAVAEYVSADAVVAVCRLRFLKKQKK